MYFLSVEGVERLSSLDLSYPKTPNWSERTESTSTHRTIDGWDYTNDLCWSTIAVREFTRSSIATYGLDQLLVFYELVEWYPHQRCSFEWVPYPFEATCMPTVVQYSDGTASTLLSLKGIQRMRCLTIVVRLNRRHVILGPRVRTVLYRYP